MQPYTEEKRAKISRQNNIIEIANGFFNRTFFLQSLPLIKTNPNHQLEEF